MSKLEPVFACFERVYWVAISSNLRCIKMPPFTKLVRSRDKIRLSNNGGRVILFSRNFDPQNLSAVDFSSEGQGPAAHFAITNDGLYAIRFV